LAQRYHLLPEQIDQRSDFENARTLELMRLESDAAAERERRREAEARRRGRRR
jgi:hypothetical protein